MNVQVLLINGDFVVGLIPLPWNPSSSNNVTVSEYVGSRIVEAGTLITIPMSAVVWWISG